MIPNVLYLKGPKAALNNAAIRDGQILLATDTAELFIDNGTSRLQIGAGSSAGGSAITNVMLTRPSNGVHLILKYTSLWGTLSESDTYIDTTNGLNNSIVRCLKTEEDGDSWAICPDNGFDSTYTNIVSLDLSGLSTSATLLYYAWQDSDGILSEYSATVYPSTYAANGDYTSSDTPEAEDTDALTFTALEPNSTVALVYSTSLGGAEYSTDGGITWNTFTSASPIVLHEIGDKVQFRSNDTGDQSFLMTGKIAAGGNYDSVCRYRNFRNLFKGCTSLVSAPPFPSRDYTYAANCEGMFENTGLTSTPPMDNVYVSSTENMFAGCTALTNIGTISLYFNNISGSCNSMFEGCTSLTSVEGFNISLSLGGNYEEGSSFAGYEVYAGRLYANCSSLLKATIPTFSNPSMTWATFTQMFQGCSRLSQITVDFDSWANFSTDSWVEGVSETGNFICPDGLEEIRGINNIPAKWSINGEPSITIDNPLCFTLTSGSSISFSCSPRTIKYSTDGETWNDYTSNTSIIGVDKVYFYNPENTLSSEDSQCQFSITGAVAASGNIMSLINYGVLTQYCFFRLFESCTGLTSSPELPATALADYCYRYMFAGCTGLTSAPALPATNLGWGCYSHMFRGCTGLTSAPELPDTTLVHGCYYYMFAGCTGLTSAPALPATTLADYCYDGMFINCTSLTSAPELPATTLAYGCYEYMFQGCTGLTSAPELPATTLVSNCYDSMFEYCTSLTEIKVHFTQWIDDCTTNWVKGVAGTGIFNCPETLDVEAYGDSWIPERWVNSVTLTYIQIPAYSTGFLLKSGAAGASGEIASFTTAISDKKVYYNYICNAIMPTGSIAESDGENIQISALDPGRNAFYARFTNEAGDHSDYNIFVSPEYFLKNRTPASSITLNILYSISNGSSAPTQVDSKQITLPIASITDCRYISFKMPDGADHVKIKHGTDVIVDTYSGTNHHKLGYCLYSGNSVTWESPARGEGIPQMAAEYPIVVYPNY